MKTGRVWIIVLFLILWSGLQPVAAPAGPATGQSRGQTVYLPVYSHIYYGDRARKINLTVTASVRNTDPAATVTITSVKYYDSNGVLIEDYLEAPQDLGPLAAARWLVAESDLKGGSGACFVIKWKASQKVSPPVVQGIMIGTVSTQGISFLTEGQVIEEAGD
ncbi:MAG: DUF3124 domain-containing protein [Thermodesulfobacteriota bacterium]